MKPNYIKKIFNKTTVTRLTVFLSLGPSILFARLDLDIETGLVFSGYNDVRIPGTTGTKFSLSRELKTDSELFYRARLTYSLNDRSKISILIAPLRLFAKGKINKLVKFEGKEFPANTQLDSRYRFDSYRFTYRYDFKNSGKLQPGIGLTAKVRDASISLEGNNIKSEKKNTGFVPLVNFRIQWILKKNLSFLLDGDALASPQGRAEDVLLAVLYNPKKNLALKLGYRILEGGADVDEVYSFALINYFVAGALFSF